MRRALSILPASLWVALAIWVAFGLLHLVGLRGHVSVLSGTPVPGVGMAEAALGAGLYVSAWLAAVIAAPILGLAGLIGLGFRRAIDAARRGAGHLPHGA